MKILILYRTVTIPNLYDKNIFNFYTVYRPTYFPSGNFLIHYKLLLLNITCFTRGFIK